VCIVLILSFSSLNSSLGDAPMPDSLQYRTAICATPPTLLLIVTFYLVISSTLSSVARCRCWLSVSQSSRFTTLTVKVFKTFCFSRHVISLCTLHLTTPRSCALGRRLSLPAVVRGILSIIGIAHLPTICLFSSWLLYRCPISRTTEPGYGSIHSFLQDFRYPFLLVLSLQGIYDAGFISFLCISLYLPSICPILLSVSVSLPRALGCLVYWSTDHFMILGFSNTRRSSGLHGRQDLYNHYEPSSISVSSASRPWLPGLLVNWPFYDSHFPQRSLPVGASRTWSLGPRQLIRTFRNLLLFPSLCLAPSVAWFIGHLTIL